MPRPEQEQLNLGLDLPVAPITVPTKRDVLLSEARNDSGYSLIEPENGKGVRLPIFLDGQDDLEISELRLKYTDEEEFVDESEFSDIEILREREFMFRGSWGTKNR